MNTYVNFGISKLLTEKGFVCHKSDKFWKDGFSCEKKDYNPIAYQYKVNVATIAEVVMWLYYKHGVWISVDMVFEEHQTGFWYIIRESKSDDVDIQSEEYKTPTAAYEAAILHVLNNLI
jgi:hypothetical protein